MKAKHLPFAISLIIIGEVSFAQDTTSNFSFSGYVDAYAAYYTDSMRHGSYQLFPTVSPLSEQFGLNIAQLSAKYSGERLRSTITLHYGDIPQSAWNGKFNMIQEANVGFRICDKLWLDAGFFRTHIGAEGLYPKENIASSISIPTFYEPYYEGGLKLNYLPTDKLTINGFLLNGYNMFDENNRLFSGGLNILYTFSDNFSASYCNYFGDDSPDGDTITHFRFYNNICLFYEAGKFKLTAGFDFASQQNSSLEDSTASASMYSGLIAAHYFLTDKFDIYARGEMFNDPDGFLSGAFENNNGEFTGLKISGFTLGAEFKPTENSYIRLEGRALQTDSHQKIFYWDGEKTNTRTEMLMNFGIWFE